MYLQQYTQVLCNNFEVLCLSISIFCWLDTAFDLRSHQNQQKN